jgi:serine/threonine protein kinase/tetratricopeptide (TPR) repeat protein
MPLAAGTRLGPYEILAPLGSGGMGEVWRARDSRLGRDVAIKVLPEAVASDPDRLVRFEREAKSVAALNHPNIVTLYSIEEANGVRFLTMELVEGDALDVLVVPGGMALARVFDLAIPLCDALSAAHAKGVVHRDLKPANVMVSREGRVKVLDFGLAKLADPGAGIGATLAATRDAPISGVGLVVGTVPYMAPEQLRGEPVDARTDLFALGVLLYELATGRRPFVGASAIDISSAILRDLPPPPRSVRGDLPPDLDRIIGRCLEKDPERRAQSAKDVRNELELSRGSSGASDARPRRERTKPTPSGDAPSIAVLPFANRSASAEDEYFSDGLADELISVLVKIRGLRVSARTSSASFKGKDATIEDVGRALNVRTVLEGSVRKAGNRVRISVQLVRVEDGEALWSETYDRMLDDIFAVQDDIAQSVVKELRTTLLGEAPDSDASGEAKAEVAAAAKGRGVDAEAHRLYMEGRHFLGGFNDEGMAKGVAALEAAVAADPTHALAWAELARAHVLQGAYGWRPVVESYTTARAEVERALALAPDLAEAYQVRSSIESSFDWNWKAAEASALRALELAPGSAYALATIGGIEHRRGRFAEAEAHLLRAVAQDPLSSRIYNNLGLIYRAMGRGEDAKQMYRKSIDLAPQGIGGRHVLAAILALEGRIEEAFAAVKLEPAEWARLTSEAIIHHCAGNRAESDVSLAALIERHSQDSAYQIAMVHVVRGELDEGMRWLEHGRETRDSGVSLAFAEPMLRPMHTHPRWPAFLRSIGFEA